MFDKVQDLLFRADFFIDSHKKLRVAFLDRMPNDPIKETGFVNLPVTNLTMLNANLYFFEAVSGLASLLRDAQSDPTKDEISFHGLIERLPDNSKREFRSKLEVAFDEYKKSGLKEVRDKYVDHKDLKLSGDPSAAFINLPAQGLVDSCSKLIASLKQLYQEYFPDGTANNYFSDYYSAAIDLHVQFLQDKTREWSPYSYRFVNGKSDLTSPPAKTHPTILQAIGNTPLVRLNKVVPPGSADVFVKLEYYNPTGSYKDRMALAMIGEAEKRGDLRPGMTVVEYTGGSTGSSLAFVCAVKGYRFHVVSSDAFAQEKLQTMKAFGAQLEIIQSEGGNVTPDLIPRMMQRAKEITEAESGFFTNQLHNADASKGYEQIGEEILQQINGPVHAFCASVGTAHMLMGVARILRRRHASSRIVALEPASTPVISKGISGTHHVEGIGIGFVPPLLDKSLYDEARGIKEADARNMAWRLAREEGIFAGTSSGMNVLGASMIARELGPGHTVVTVAVDTGLKYLAGDLFGGEHP